MATYLADSSVIHRQSQPIIGARTSELGSRLKLCSPVIFELGYSARNAAGHRFIVDRSQSYDVVPTTDADFRRAIEVQGLLAERGQHRSLSLVDALVAAIAESRDLVVLHYDADFDLIADVTGQPTEWIVPAGTAN
jgi:predicted nucleic acid-binding protein